MEILNRSRGAMHGAALSHVEFAVELLTKAQVASRANVPPYTVTNATVAGTLKPAQGGSGRPHLYSPEEVDRWAAWRALPRNERFPVAKGLGRERSGRKSNERGTAFDHVIERRTDTDLEALLADVLTDLRSGTRKRVPSDSRDPLPF